MRMELRGYSARTLSVLLLLSVLAGGLPVGGSTTTPTPLFGVQLVRQVGDIAAPPPTRLDSASWPRMSQAQSSPARQEQMRQISAPSGMSVTARRGQNADDPRAWLLMIGIFLISMVAVGAVVRWQRRRHRLQNDREVPLSLSPGGPADSSNTLYADLDDDERAEAVAYEAQLRSDPARAELLHGQVPTGPGTVLTRRSLWPFVAVVVLVFFLFGAVVQQLPLIAAAGLVVAIGMVVHGRGAARRIEVAEHGDLIISGGLWGRTVRLTDFDWARAYRPSTGIVKPASTVVLRRKAGRSLFTKAVAAWFPTVSPRRTTIALASVWRCPALGQRVGDNTMAEFIRLACRQSGMRVEWGKGQRIWTAVRTR